MSELSDEGIECLGQKAAESLKVLDEYLDELTGAREAKQFGDKEGMRDNVLFHRSVFNGDALGSQDVDRLLGVLASGDIMDRVVACMRILRIPPSQRPAEHAVDYMTVAQRHLSKLLVAHPVLMHNRIMVKGMHFNKAEYGPIATIIAESPDAELPRLAHGVPLEKLKEFAKHECVRVGLMSKAPIPRPSTDTLKYQGLTMLAAVFGRNTFDARPRMLTALMELDNVRETRRGRAPSFLVCSGKTEAALRTGIANTLLSECGMASKPSRSAHPAPIGFLDALKGSTIPHQPWFLPHLQTRLTRWPTLDANDQVAAMRSLAKALLHIEPSGLRMPAEIGVIGDPRALTNWLISAVLDSSSERASEIGQRFKTLLSVRGDVAVSFIGLLEELEPTAPPGDVAERMTKALGDATGDAAQVWHAALRTHAMRAAIAASSESAAHFPSPQAAAPRRSMEL